jgi:Domain of unknown function (DU1801)
MKLEVSSIEELFVKSEEHEELIRLIDKIIQETAPDLKRQLVTEPNITMVGYGEMLWQTSLQEEVCPLISLAPQKHTVNLYIAAEKDGLPLPQYFIESFGKTAVGKNCIRIRSINTLDSDVLKELVRETLLWADLKCNTYGQNCAVPR